jgi:hypothetical protein
MCMLNLRWTSRSKRHKRSPILEGIAMSMVAAYNELQCVCQKFVTLFMSLYGSSSQWIAMRIYARVMPEVCYSICVNNLHFLCLVLQWNVNTNELMNFVMCDALRFVTQLSFHPFFIIHLSLLYVTNFLFFIHTDEAKTPHLTSELLLCSIHP